MTLFDTHAHLNFPDYEQDYREVWERAHKAGLVGLVNVGTDLATSRRGVEIAHELDLWAAVGIHPHEATHYASSTDWHAEMERLVKDARVVAVGETGFDFFRQFSTPADQAALLEYFLDLASKEGKPVLFHCRDAYGELLDFLQSRKQQNSQSNTPGVQPIRGVVHAFGGEVPVAKEFLDLGLYLSVTAQVTYPQNQDRYRRLMEYIPLDRLLLETDCPFLPPEGLRGQRNEPRHIDVVAETIARFTGRTREEVAAMTTKNALDLFGLSQPA